MQLMNLEPNTGLTPPSCFGKTSRGSSAQRTTPSDASWENLLEQTLPYHPEQADGRVRVWLPDPSAKQRGESSTLNISESPNDVVVSSLSQVLKTDSIPQKYFLSARVRGDSASCERSGEGLASASVGGSHGDDQRTCLSLYRACFSQGKNAKYNFSITEDVAQTLTARGPSAVCYDMTHACDVIRESREAPTLQARMGTGGNQIPLVLDTPKLYNTALAYGTVTEGTVCKTLTAQIDNQTDCPLVLQENGNSRAIGVGVPPPLKTTTVPCFATGGVVGTLTACDAEKQFASNQAVDSGMLVTTPQAGVRRLTPVECERLQGFPDNWTRIPWRGKLEENCPDAPRYKAIGNSWAVPCVRWIGERLKIELEQNER